MASVRVGVAGVGCRCCGDWCWRWTSWVRMVGGGRQGRRFGVCVAVCIGFASEWCD